MVLVFIVMGITNADFEDISTKTFTGNDDYTFIITSRMGQTYEILMIDNIRIDTQQTTYRQPKPYPTRA